MDRTATQPRAANRYWVLTLLVWIYAFNSMDRYVISILAEPIRIDLNLTDTQLGILSGFAFAVFYTVFGVPVGWLADRFGRIRLLTLACSIWSLCSAAGALATSFVHLAFARIGVGIGEAGGAAPSYSAITSTFSKKERGRALGIFSCGSPLGTLIGVAGCGWIAAHYGWRPALVAVSLPGVALALVLYFTVPEPMGHGDEDPRSQPFVAALKGFFQSPLLVFYSFASGLTAFITYGLLSWTPAYLMREKGMTLTELAAFYSIGQTAAFAFGLWLGGYLVDRYAKLTRRAYSFIPIAGNLIALPFYLLALARPDWQTTLLLMMIPIALNAVFVATSAVFFQESAPPSLRTLYSAVYLMINNLIGHAVGPLYIGMISDLPGSNLSFGMWALGPIFLLGPLAHYFVSRLLARHSFNEAVATT